MLADVNMRLASYWRWTGWIQTTLWSFEFIQFSVSTTQDSR